MNVPCATFATVRSKLEVSGVGPLLTGPLPDVQVGHSFGFETVTTLPPRGLVADEEIVTSRISMLLPPDAIEVEFVHVAFGAAPTQVQPGDEPAFIA